MSLQSLYVDLKQRLDVYRTSKAVLQRELRSEVDKLREASPAERRKALQEFARIQTP